jgi:hypothetical protein
MMSAASAVLTERDILGTLVIGYFTNAGRIAEHVEALLAESGRAETG